MKSFTSSVRSLFATALLIVVATTTALNAAALETPVVQQADQLNWELQEGDWIYVTVNPDTRENTMRFVREDHSYMSDKIQVGSGKLLQPGETFSYLGMTYDPATPEKVWEIRSKHQQNWWNVFGSHEANDQPFFRLYDKGTYTHYGIHTTPNIDTIINDLDGFGSWGCVLTRYDLLMMIDELYELNDHVVKVVTSSQDSDSTIAVLAAF